MQKTPFIYVQEVQEENGYLSYLEITLKLDSTRDAPCFTLATSETDMQYISRGEVDAFVNQAADIANALKIVMVISEDIYENLA